MLRVGDLREMLDSYDDDDIVVIPTGEDDEFTPIETISSGYYMAEDSDFHFAGDFVDHDDLLDDDKINIIGSQTAIVLWPL